MAGSTEPFTDGSIITAGGQNSAHARKYTLEGLNHIRQLIDRAGVYSAGQIDGWGEAYIDADGRNNSVDTGTTTSLFYTDKYPATSNVNSAPSDTTHDPNSFTNVNNAFDENLTTYANKTVANSATQQYGLGKTFASKGIGIAVVKYYADWDNNIGNNYIKIQTYNGSTWTDVETLETLSAALGTVTDTKTIIINSTVEGVRIYFDFTGTTSQDLDARVYEISYYEPSTVEIYHTIPTGTFPATISSAIGIPLIEDWETGANIQYKLTNTGGDDSGWLDAMDTSPEVSSFTAFTAEPDTLIVKLIPKTTSPTAAYPSVRGFFINTWSD